MKKYKQHLLEKGTKIDTITRYINVIRKFKKEYDITNLKRSEFLTFTTGRSKYKRQIIKRYMDFENINFIDFDVVSSEKYPDYITDYVKELNQSDLENKTKNLYKTIALSLYRKHRHKSITDYTKDELLKFVSGSYTTRMLNIAAVKCLFEHYGLEIASDIKVIVTKPKKKQMYDTIESITTDKEKLKKKKKTPLKLTNAEIKKLLDWVKSVPIQRTVKYSTAMIITLALNVGLRLEEIQSLEADCLIDGRVKVIGKYSRYVDVSDNLYKLLKNYSRMTYNKKHLTFIKSSTGKQITTVGIAKRLRELFRELGVYTKERPIAASHLRHTYASTMYNDFNMPIEKVSQQMGHGYIQTTERLLS